METKEMKREEMIPPKANDSEVYANGEADGKIAAAVAGAGHLTRTIVDALPDVGEADENTIYMLKKTGDTDDPDTDDQDGYDEYDEYCVIEGKWEKIGDTVEEPTEEKKPEEIEDHDEMMDYLEEHYTMEQVMQVYKHAKEILQIMESTWKSTVLTYKVNHEQIERLVQINRERRTAKPETPILDKDGKEIPYDPCNGVLTMTEQEVVDLFGEDHPIIGVTHELTLDRIHEVYEDFYNWAHALQEFREIDRMYIEYTDAKEAEQLQILKESAEKEEDPERKHVIELAIRQYYNKIYLAFLAEPIPMERIQSVVQRLGNAEKAQYILKRAADKLKQMKVSAQFIPEIVKFESTFLPEEYHCCDGVLLLYFCDMIVHCDVHDAKDQNRNNAIYMTIMLDRFIRNMLKDDVKEQIKQNLLVFEQKFVDLVPKPESKETITPPIDNPTEFQPVSE